MPQWTAAKRALKYQKGTKNRGLTFRPTKKPLVGYADADWASDITDRKSYSGCVLNLLTEPSHGKVKSNTVLLFPAPRRNILHCLNVPKKLFIYAVF
ncbi:hypothetical protein AVEN_170270-1 [Araneus ventricosus]|uniref:Uncharacterized protein n=1 Tax=Araneus ventricosus TaxID=182803 RepID=A0A4Y2H7G7_ARAVE|nr:hypothetical protein AVEN_170270-1 [Araneus ventricosus]